MEIQLITSTFNTIITVKYNVVEIKLIHDILFVGQGVLNNSFRILIFRGSVFWHGHSDADI